MKIATLPARQRILSSMVKVLHVAATLVALTACHRDVRDAHLGTIELEFEPVQRASAPDPALELDLVREMLARRLAGLPVPVEVKREGGQLVVALRGDAGPNVISRVKAAVLTQGRFELREFADNARGPLLVDNRAIRDARSKSAGDTPAIAVRLRRDAADPFEAATRKIVGSRVVVTLDDYLIAASVVEAPISGGEFQFPLGMHPPPTRERADTIALVLTAGEPLPFPFRYTRQRHVPPRAK